jgi:hypothetical protein
MKLERYQLAVCADGFTVSIQAHHGAYCSPRDDVGPYSAVEVGYPNRTDALLLPYAEDPGSPTDTVYGYVPSTVVLEVLQSHGGWVSGEIPPMELTSDDHRYNGEEGEE